MTSRFRLMLGMAAALIAAVTPVAYGGTAGPSAAQPSQAMKGPGSDGHCGIASLSFDNAAAPGNPIFVYQPKGKSAAVVGGGRCADRERPTIFMAHGLGGTDPSNYIAFIEHLVSVGNIVVYPTYQVTSGSKAALAEAYRYMDAGNRQAVRRISRIDTRAVGFWGHSFGASMVPYLAVQAGRRGWGTNGLWVNNVAMTFALMVGPDAIRLPAYAQVLTIGFEDDGLADNRIGDEVFRAFSVAQSHKRHLTLVSDAHGAPAVAAEHNAPIATAGPTYTPDAIDFALWRDLDLLETCAISDRLCNADYSVVGTWSDGTPMANGIVSDKPRDVGPYPAALAECDGVYGRMLNDERIHRCGQTHITIIEP